MGYYQDYVKDIKDFHGNPAKKGGQPSDFIPPKDRVAPKSPEEVVDKGAVTRDADVVAKNYPAQYAQEFVRFPFLKKRSEVAKIKDESTLKLLMQYERNAAVLEMIRGRVEELKK